ncbi:NTE family protein [Limimonas halophila]|uniref:NTE family protein n=1 Tax=Limimonas halophila TaxID=1082479 RepID=A0A1G7QIX3_9PROT|nr:patatin-like phospholipase family protein [Limimonas halophila]SDF98481.1 NTE family protein [Limimonas halophila]
MSGDPIRVNLALQGGGAHGAFTWGVLDRLLEEPDIVIDGVSGTSAGAMNAAVLADGMARGGNQGARERLAQFWDTVIHMGRFGPLVRTPLDAMAVPWNMEYSPGYMIFDAISRYFSPYQFNPMNWNPLLAMLRETIDFDRVRACDCIKLFVAATAVRTGKLRVFHTREMTPEAVMASACLPHVFQAVEIDGEPYWDGGYMGNPALFPLIYNCDASDIMIVQVNPLARDETPTTTPAILDRVNEISFNATLMREMRAIDFVSRLVAEHKLESDGHKPVRLHRVDVPEPMRHLSAASKLNAERSFLNQLHAWGREQADGWLADHRRDLGARSTIDIERDTT